MVNGRSVPCRMVPADIWDALVTTEQGREDQSQPYGWVLRSVSDVTKMKSHDTRKLRQFDYPIFIMRSYPSNPIELPLPNHVEGNNRWWEDR